MSPKTEVVQKYRKLIRGTIEKEIYKRKLEAKVCNSKTIKPVSSNPILRYFNTEEQL
jgi:hypothetical protein